ncbi:MAG: D-alanyl-D-alanine carboxypeptidase family protein, partial [Syntrophothermus sp.]
RFTYLVAAVLLLALITGRVFHSDQPASTKAIRPIIQYVRDYDRGPGLSAEAAVLIDAASATVLYGKNEHQQRPPASTTKIMTAILALERGNLDDLVTVGRSAIEVDGSSLEIEPGHTFRLRDLLGGLLIESGNDAAAAIAEHLGKNQEGFVKMMNERAAELGAWNTNFVNPNGLPAAGHYSSAFDLALMTMRALQIPAFREIVRTREKNVESHGGNWARQLENTNKLLWTFEGADGVKTGTTTEAGECLVASATRDGWQLIAVVLKSKDRWEDAATLLEYGFENFSPVNMVKSGEVVMRARVKNGLVDDVPLITSEPLRLILRKDETGLIMGAADVKPDLTAPILPGEVAGKFRAFVGSEQMRTVDLLAVQGVERRTIWHTLRRLFRR